MLLVWKCICRSPHSGLFPSLLLTLWWWLSNFPSLPPSFLVYKTKSKNNIWCLLWRLDGMIMYLQHISLASVSVQKRWPTTGSVKGAGKQTTLSKRVRSVVRWGLSHRAQGSDPNSIPMSLQDGALLNDLLSPFPLLPTDDLSSHIFRNWIFWLLCCKGRFDMAFAIYVFINWYINFSTIICLVNNTAK